ncbi:hypothetical protein D0T84_00825 [Dysgonomonas sp. 521]|uniref:hypothetical protein n=1 Tax=Dysgonomonas sp. 521 TaxID=2302932 RepID=UPI0013D4300F|nr:hypothetical protein [Dysgonomonas sp. 521]NDV93461.1 hypothetical protein [Dysgonomonas sp. 521]
MANKELSSIEKRAKEYAEKSNKAVGFPNTNIARPVELGFLSGANVMKGKAVAAFATYLENYCGLDACEKRYKELLNDFTKQLEK